MREALGVKPIAAVLFVALFGTVSAYSQATASLRGTITDPSGAVIPDAAVAIKSADNGTTRKSTTDTQGEYSFLQVAPGSYKLAAEKPGFATMTKSDIKLLVNTPATLDLKMSLSTTGEIVNVASETSQVNTTDASVGNPFSEAQVRQLPLQTRNVVELLSLQPGVTTAKSSEPIAIRTTSRSTAPTSTTTKTRVWFPRPPEPAPADTKAPTPMA